MEYIILLQSVVILGLAIGYYSLFRFFNAKIDEVIELVFDETAKMQK